MIHFGAIQYAYASAPSITMYRAASIIGKILFSTDKTRSVGLPPVIAPKVALAQAVHI